MARPTYIEIDTAALRHNVQRVRAQCKQQKMIAMVKANAYGCGLAAVIPVLKNEVDALGVACLEEAMAVRQMTEMPCILFQGIFSPEELSQVMSLNLECVVHHRLQLEWILNFFQNAAAAPQSVNKPIRVWIKVNTGMQRLGFEIAEIPEMMRLLNQCAGIDKDIGLMTHMASADEPSNAQNQTQIERFKTVVPELSLTRSIANSAFILSSTAELYDVVRPGIMLYGVSPFKDQNSKQLNLKPVMHFYSAISVIHTYLPHQPVGYGGTWKTPRVSRIGTVAAGYGDGYPRHIKENTPVWINGYRVPIVGRVSMDMLTVDLTDVPENAVQIGTPVELWGEHILVEEIANQAGTIAYELICQVSSRVREKTHLI